MNKASIVSNIVARVCIVLGLSAVWICPTRAQSQDGLEVANGDFSDLSDLGPVNPNGWYTGIPASWTASSNDPIHSINDKKGTTPPICNVSQLGFLQQSVGSLSREADVAISFDVSEPWAEGAVLGVALLDGEKSPIVHAEFKAGDAQILVAPKVPAGTAVSIQFWAVGGSLPGLDNVSIKTFDPGTAPAGPGGR